MRFVLDTENHTSSFVVTPADSTSNVLTGGGVSVGPPVCKICLFYVDFLSPLFSVFTLTCLLSKCEYLSRHLCYLGAGGEYSSSCVSDVIGCITIILNVNRPQAHCRDELSLSQGGAWGPSPSPPSHPNP